MYYIVVYVLASFCGMYCTVHKTINEQKAKYCLRLLSTMSLIVLEEYSGTSVEILLRSEAAYVKLCLTSCRMEKAPARPKYSRYFVVLLFVP